LIARHGFDGSLGQDTLAAPHALVEHHTAEGVVVVDRRHQPTGAGLKCGRAAVFTVLGAVEHFELFVRLVELIKHWQAMELRRGNAEGGVLHAKRLEQALEQERFK